MSYLCGAWRRAGHRAKARELATLARSLDRRGLHRVARAARLAAAEERDRASTL